MGCLVLRLQTDRAPKSVISLPNRLHSLLSLRSTYFCSLDPSLTHKTLLKWQESMWPNNLWSKQAKGDTSRDVSENCWGQNQASDRNTQPQTKRERQRWGVRDLGFPPFSDGASAFGLPFHMELQFWQVGEITLWFLQEKNKCYCIADHQMSIQNCFPASWKTQKRAWIHLWSKYTQNIEYLTMHQIDAQDT